MLHKYEIMSLFFTLTMQKSSQKDLFKKQKNPHRSNSESPNPRTDTLAGIRTSDLLYITEISKKKYFQVKRQLIQTVKNQAIRKQRLKEIEKYIFKLPNKEIHQHLKQQVVNKIENVIQSMLQYSDQIKKLNLQNVENKDLIFIFEVKAIIKQIMADLLQYMNQIRQKQYYSQEKKPLYYENQKNEYKPQIPHNNQKKLKKPIKKQKIEGISSNVIWVKTLIENLQLTKSGVKIE